MMDFVQTTLVLPAVQKPKVVRMDGYYWSNGQGYAINGEAKNREWGICTPFDYASVEDARLALREYADRHAAWSSNATGFPHVVEVDFKEENPFARIHEERVAAGLTLDEVSPGVQETGVVVNE